jgi:pyruvate ferredoxin oxidoreductase beta subunit
MDRFSVFVPRLLPAAEPFISAMRSCPGCGQALAVRIIGKALTDHGRHPYGGVQPDVTVAAFPYAGWQTFPPRNVQPAASKIDTAQVLAVAGESGAFEDMFSLLQEAGREGTRLCVICFLNEAGIERHAGMPSANYSHDSIKSFCERLDGMHLILDRVRSLRPDFMATACPSYPFDLIEKVHGALASRISFLAVFVPCPTGCLYDPSLGLRSGKQAVQTGFFPLYQRTGGKAAITIEPQRLAPVAAYMSMQQAYSVSADETARVQDMVTTALRKLRQERP